MTNSPPIVGLLLNYRDAGRSSACVLSLLEQPLQHVLVWDNSADGGRSAGEVSARFAGDARVRVIVSDRNLGFAAGVNRGIEACRAWVAGAWVLLINNDARLLPGGAQRLGRALIERADASIAFPKINHAGNVLGPIYYQFWTGLLFWSPRAGTFPYASGCCLLIAPERMRLPVFDEAFFMYGEDCELGWRLAAADSALLYIPEVLVEHDGSASSGLGTPFYEERLVASHLVLVRKLAGNRAALRLLLYLSRAVMLTARALVRSLRYRSLVPLRALARGAAIAFIADPLR